MTQTSPETVDTGTEELLCEVRERVAVITLNRPHARNSLSDRLTPALRTMIATCAGRADIGAVVITGTGTAFCAGGDVKGMGDGQPRGERTLEDRIIDLQDKQRRLTGAIVALRKPVIAALPGPAAGAGLSIALACDLRVGAESAFVSTAYARIGLAGDYGMAWLLTRLVGTGRARELMYFADRIDARRCLELGIFNRVVPDARVRDEAFETARALAHGPAVALRLMKDNLDDALSENFLYALDREAERMVRSSQTTDHKEAVRAFVEKRPARFSGN